MQLLQIFVCIWEATHSHDIAHDLRASHLHTASKGLLAIACCFCQTNPCSWQPLLTIEADGEMDLFTIQKSALVQLYIIFVVAYASCTRSGGPD